MKRAVLFLFIVACSKKEPVPAVVESSVPLAVASAIDASADANKDDIFTTWNTYKSAKASVSILGPITVIWEDKANKTTFKIAGSPTGDIALRAEAIEALAPEMTNQQKTLEEYAHKAGKEASGYGGVSIKPIMLKTHAGREEVSKKDAVLLRVRVYLVGRTIYTLTADRKENDLDAEKTVSRFLESLVLAD